jgi:hypothetical protein
VGTLERQREKAAKPLLAVQKENRAAGAGKRDFTTVTARTESRVFPPTMSRCRVVLSRIIASSIRAITLQRRSLKPLFSSAQPCKYIAHILRKTAAHPVVPPVLSTCFDQRSPRANRCPGRPHILDRIPSGTSTRQSAAQRRIQPSHPLLFTACRHQCCFHPFGAI